MGILFCKATKCFKSSKPPKPDPEPEQAPEQAQTKPVDPVQRNKPGSSRLPPIEKKPEINPDMINFTLKTKGHKKQPSFVTEAFGTPKSTVPALEEDIIILCGLQEMVKGFFKDYVIVWHDPNVDSEENKRHKAQLERYCDVKTFKEWGKASKYVKEAKAICHVLTSGTNGELLVKEIWSSPTVFKINVFCGNKDFHSTWASKYSTKISCIEVEILNVLHQIEQNLLKWYQEASSLRTNLPAFAPIFNNWDKSKINYLHHYLKVLPNFKNRSQAKNDFISLSKAIFSDPTNTNIIKDFENNYIKYNKNNILTWYTHESFLYKVTNNCLRIASSDSIQYCRLLLKDLEQAIKEQYKEKSKNFNGLLYRGAYLSQEEWNSLKANHGQEVEMHGFLSASKDKNIGLRFMLENPDQKVFITIIVPKGPNEEEQGFAEVKEFSKYPEEEEVLFNVRSRFTVLEAEDTNLEGLPYRHLVLLYGAQGFRKYMTEQNPVQETSIANIEKISCTKCHASFNKMMVKPINTGLLQEALYRCPRCLPSALHSNQAPFLYIPDSISKSYKARIKGLVMDFPRGEKLPMYGYKCCKCQATKREAYLKCTECSRKEVWCVSCLPSLAGCVKEGHAIVIESQPFQFWCEKMSENELNHLKFQSKIVVKDDDVFQQAEMFFKCHQYQKSIDFYKIFIRQNEKNRDMRQLATCYHNLGGVYDSQGDYDKALKCLSEALKMRKSLYGGNHTDIAASLNSLGSVYNNKGEPKKAAEYYKKAWEMRESTSKHDPHERAKFFNNIAVVCYNMGEYQNALEYHSSALKERTSLHGENHPEVANSYNKIGLVYSCQKEYKKAQEYHTKALDIQKLIFGDNHPDVAISFNNIGDAFYSQGDRKKALACLLKAGEIRNLIYGENHTITKSTNKQIENILKNC